MLKGEQKEKKHVWTLLFYLSFLPQYLFLMLPYELMEKHPPLFFLQAHFSVKNHPGAREWVQISDPPMTNHMTLDKLYNYSVSQFLHLYNGDNTADSPAPHLRFLLPAINHGLNILSGNFQQ